MAARLIVSAAADADTGEILDYLAREAGRPAASEYGRRFQRTLNRVVDMPESGAPRPALGPEARKAVVYPYILIYDYAREDDTVTCFESCMAVETLLAIF